MYIKEQRKIPIPDRIIHILLKLRSTISRNDVYTATYYTYNLAPL